MIHHMTVHFPIALLFVAGGLYVFGLFHPKHPYSQTAFLLHVIGVIGIGVSVLSGNTIKGEIAPETEAYELLQQHQIVGYVLLWLFGMLLVWRYLRLKKIGKIEHWGFIGLFVAGLGVVVYGAWLGGQM